MTFGLQNFWKLDLDPKEYLTGKEARKFQGFE